MILTKSKPEVDNRVFQEFGKVILSEGQTFLVRSESGDFQARRAAGCLLAPALGDLVLIAAGASGGCFILTVLERPDGALSRINIQGDLELRVDGGRLEVRAESGIDLATGRDMSVQAVLFNANVARAEVVASSCFFGGTWAQFQMDKVKVLASSIDSTVKRVIQRLKRSYRFVEDSEVIRAGRVDLVAEENISVRGKNALVTAQELVKVDADQIHLG